MRKRRFVKQLVNEQPILAFRAEPRLFNQIEKFTVALCIEFLKCQSVCEPDLETYERIRSAVNESAETQLQAIVGGLNDKKIVPPREFFRLGKQFNLICLYEPFKSKECIYE